MYGEVQPGRVVVSILQVKVAPVSVELKLNVGFGLFVGDVIEVSDVSGATVSTVQLRVAGLWSRLPAASTASTRNVCDPWLSVLKVIGLLQPVKSCVSIWHRNVEPPSVELNVKVAEVEAVGADGPVRMFVSGGVRSIVHVYGRGRRVRVPGGVDRAAPWNVCDPAASPE